jgi:hypothetical protein
MRMCRMDHGSPLYANILRPEQDTAWPAAEHVAYILTDPAIFFRNKEN